jgi:hypothetical protein
MILWDGDCYYCVNFCAVNAIDWWFELIGGLEKLRECLVLFRVIYRGMELKNIC